MALLHKTNENTMYMYIHIDPKVLDAQNITI